MAYEHDMPAAAHRLLDAGKKLQLEQNRRRDVAGYLFGLAAECAVKAMAERFPELRRDEVFYAHFPELRTFVLDFVQGRSAQPLVRLLEHDRFMNEWHVKIRYARKEHVTSKPVEMWQDQAARAVSLMTGEGG